MQGYNENLNHFSAKDFKIALVVVGGIAVFVLLTIGLLKNRIPQFSGAASKPVYPRTAEVIPGNTAMEATVQVKGTEKSPVMQATVEVVPKSRK